MKVRCTCILYFRIKIFKKYRKKYILYLITDCLSICSSTISSSDDEPEKMTCDHFRNSFHVLPYQKNKILYRFCSLPNLKINKNLWEVNIFRCFILFFYLVTRIFTSLSFCYLVYLKRLNGCNSDASISTFCFPHLLVSYDKTSRL